MFFQFHSPIFDFSLSLKVSSGEATHRFRCRFFNDRSHLFILLKTLLMQFLCMSLLNKLLILLLLYEKQCIILLYTLDILHNSLLLEQ